MMSGKLIAVIGVFALAIQACGGGNTATCPGLPPAGTPFFDAVPGFTTPGWPVTGDYLDLHDYPPGNTVLVEVRDTAGGTIIGTGTGVVAGDGYLRVTVNVDLVAGNHVKVTDTGSGVARETTVALLDYSYLEMDGQVWANGSVSAADLVVGVSAPGAKVRVLILDDPLADSVHGNALLAGFDTTADGSGQWMLDLTASGFNLQDNGTSGPGSGLLVDMVAARTRDCDGDATLLFCPFC